MTPRRYNPKTADHMAGRLAQHDGHCWMCDRPIIRHASQVVLRKGDWVHASCVNGADQ